MSPVETRQQQRISLFQSLLVGVFHLIRNRQSKRLAPFSSRNSQPAQELFYNSTSRNLEHVASHVQARARPRLMKRLMIRYRSGLTNVQYSCAGHNDPTKLPV